MKRCISLFMIIIVLFILGCSSEKSKIETETPDPVIHQSKGEEIIDDGEFQLRLFSSKETYRVGEELDIKAQLTYVGELNDVKVRSGVVPVVFSTVNLTKDYRFINAFPSMAKEYTFQKDILTTHDYDFGGQYYSKHDHGQPFSDELVDRMREGSFPTSQYSVSAHVDFDNLSTGQRTLLKASIIFTVEE